MKTYFKVTASYFLLTFLSITILMAQPRKINDVISLKASSKLHYQLALGVMYQKDFSSNQSKSFKVKQKYKNQVKSLSNFIEVDTLKSVETVNVIIKTKKRADLNPALVSIHNIFPGNDYDYFTASIAINNLETVSELEGVIAIEPVFKTESFLNESTSDIHAKEVWIGGDVSNQLLDKITGKGVYVGIIEGQPNRDHITFKDKNGLCRFNYFDNPSPVNKTDSNSQAHSTFVAGIAAGQGNTGNSNASYRGVAYESNLLWYPKTGDETSADIFKKMIDLSGNAPLVVNCSEGTVFGPRDGSSLNNEALGTLIKGNKVFVAAAANNSTRYFKPEDMTYMHYQGIVPNVSGEYIEFEVKIKGTRLPIEIWHTNNIDVEVSNNHQILKWSNRVSEGNIDFFDPENSDDFINIYNQSSNSYGLDPTKPVQNKSLSKVISIQFNSEDNIFEQGIYKIRLYPHTIDNNENNKIDAYICYNGGRYGGFVNGDNYQTICSYGDTREAITVSACRKEIDGGDIASYSSLGPLRNDSEGTVSKPDITAPGGDEDIYKQINYHIINSAIAANNTEFNTFEPGTSFAAPHVAGAIALLMQCFPQLTAVQVKEILQKTSAPIPNGTLTSEDRKYWGAGKLDILAAYKSMAGFSYVKPYAYDENKYYSTYQANLGSGLPFSPVNYNWTDINLSYQKYTNGAIFSDNRETNAYWLGEGIWKKWIELDSVKIKIGLPLCSEFNDASNNNYSTVKFQKGNIFWNGSEAIVSYYLLPTLSTTNVNGISKTSASSGGVISSDGGTSITSRGVCWNTTGNPTILDVHTSDGNGIGNFTSTMTNLIANTTYHVRAYATNSAGTSYGNEASFTTQSDTDQLIMDEMDGSTLGTATGITYTTTPNGQGAVFNRLSNSRIEYNFDSQIPRQGTLELLIKVESGYYYSNYSLSENLNSTDIWGTDCHGGDVFWPGAMKISVSDNGTLSLITETAYGQPECTVLSATNTSFKFNEFHVVGISYGSEGQYLSIDGNVVASNLTYTLPLSAAGNFSQPMDKPTIGKVISSFWGNNQYDGGFIGVVDRFRSSSKQQDWALIANTPSINVLIADYPILINGNDATGNNDTMTLINTPFQNGGIYCNGIYEFSGSTNYFVANTPSIKNFNFNSFTISVDFLVTENKTQPVLVCGRGCRWLGFYLKADGTVDLLYNNENHLASTLTYTLNQWHNAQITYDGNTAKIFLDNVLACSINIQLDYAGCGVSDTQIGATNYSNGSVLKGYLKNLKIYSIPSNVINVSTNTLTIAASANSTKTFDITSNISWTATSNQTWLTLSSANGSNNATITLTATANLSTATRTATVTVSGAGVTAQTITVTQDAGTTGIIEISDNSVSLFPNPVTNELTINNISPNAIISIYDLNGKLIINKIAKSTIEKIDVSNLSSGVYSIKMTVKKAIKTNKFVKQ